jgi:HD-like signal output (HDOD) protein
MIRVLVVDDEPDILDGLELQLRAVRDRWRPRFASGGAAALRLLDTEPFDAVVTDLRMPDVDGLAVLLHAREHASDAVRIVLSGVIAPAAITRDQGLVHRMLSKPCPPDQLRDTVERTIDVVHRMACPAVREIVLGLHRLPAMPTLHARVAALRDDGHDAVRDVVAMIEREPAICARMLSLASSAAFGGSRELVTLETAVQRLGFEGVAALVLVCEIAEGFSQVSRARLEQVGACAVAASRVARRMAAPAIRDLAGIAALLHDVGLLVIAAQPELSRAVDTYAERAAVGNELAERTVLGTSHAEVGAYLLELWGLPRAIAAAVADHHTDPSVYGPLDLNGVVYVACALAEGRGAEAREAIVRGVSP